MVQVREAQGTGKARGDDPHLLSARSAAVLSGILAEIKAMYVVGLNAQLAVGRVEQGGEGFEQISMRMYDFAREMASAIERAHGLSKEVSRLIHRYHMAQAAHRPLREAGEEQKGPVLGKECRELAKELRDRIRGLLGCLQELDDLVEAADHIAVNARVEASKTRVRGQSADLDQVAGRIRESVGRIQATVDRSRPDLQALQKATTTA